MTLLELEMVWKLLGCGELVAVVFTDDFVALVAVDVYSSFPFFTPFENFFNKGFDCCCYSVKAGFCATTLDCMADY